MLSRQEEQAERLDVIENEKRLRGSTSTTDSQGSTFLGHTQNDVGGRFAAISSPQVVGSTPLPKYEGAPNWAHDPVPTEPPLGLDNPALDPSSALGLPNSDAPLTPTPLAGVERGVGLRTSSRAYRRF